MRKENIIFMVKRKNKRELMTFHILHFEFTDFSRGFH